MTSIQKQGNFSNQNKGPHLGSRYIYIYIYLEAVGALFSGLFHPPKRLNRPFQPKGLNKASRYIKGILATPPQVAKGLIASLIKGNQWLIKPLIRPAISWGGGSFGGGS